MARAGPERRREGPRHGRREGPTTARGKAPTRLPDSAVGETVVQHVKAPVGFPTGALSCVDLRGFEPLAPSMRTRCATGLRHRPLQRVKL
ncbi:hypothetical protein GPN2_11008 [Streptomyces murinus]